MNPTTPVEMLSNSLKASVIASEENQCAEIIIAKRGDLTAVVKRAPWQNRRYTRAFSLGYARFGMPAIWIVKNRDIRTTPPSSAGFNTPEHVKYLALLAFAAADEVTALRAAAK